MYDDGTDFLLNEKGVRLYDFCSFLYQNRIVIRDDFNNTHIF